MTQKKHEDCGPYEEKSAKEKAERQTAIDKAVAEAILIASGPAEPE